MNGRPLDLPAIVLRIDNVRDAGLGAAFGAAVAFGDISGVEVGLGHLKEPVGTR